MTALDMFTSWERHRIESVQGTLGRLPLYASREWWVLDDDDPRRWAAVIRAAACWRHESRLDVIDERMRAELERVDQLVVERMRAASHDIAGAADWVAIASEPTHAELTRRRAR